MPQRDDEQDEWREDDTDVWWSDDERAITLSGLLGETPEEASRRPLPPAPLKASPRRSLLLVGFSAVVVACLVALGALVTHSGQFAGVHVDRQLSGLSDAGASSGDGGVSPQPGDVTPGIHPPAPVTPPGPVPGAVQGPATAPGALPGPGGAGRSAAGRDGAGRDGVARSAGGDGAGRDGAGRDGAGGEGAGREGVGRSAGGGGAAGRDGAGSGPGVALGAPATNQASSRARAKDTQGPAGRDGRGGANGAGGDSRGPEDGRERGSGGRSDSGGGSDSGPGGGVLDAVDSVLEGLTGAVDPGASDVRLAGSWNDGHDGSGHDHSGRRADHPGLRAAPAGIAPGVRLPGR